MEIEELLRLGDQYFTPGSYDKAIEYFEKASQLGSAKASYNIGIIYHYGTIKDYNKAKDYYEKASKLGYADATFKLALIYNYGKDYMKVLNLYAKAISQNPSIVELCDKHIDSGLNKLLLLEYSKLLTQNNSLLEDISKLQKENELLKTKILYQPGGEGYLDAKNHFNQLQFK